MLWVLSDIVLPLIAACLLGLFIGWLLWRWRRSRIDANGISALRRSSARYKADAERLQQSNLELTDRLQAASSASGGTASAKRKVEQLSEELRQSRREVADLKSNAGGKSKLDQSNPSQTDLGKRTATSVHSQQDVSLVREIEARDEMIETLKQSLAQYGERGDATSLLADVALRDRKIEALEGLVDSMRRTQR